MRAYQKILVFTIPAMVLFAGCMEVRQPLDAAFRPNGGQKKDLAAKQFQDANPDGPTAVESAIELSKKYAALSDEMAKLKSEKESLQGENRRLTQQTNTLQQKLDQTKKELKDANDLLVEMRIELNNWKTDVLGFRDEMRQADKAQLEALVKILKVLGGEAKETPSEDSSASKAVKTLKKTGESNDKS